MCGIFGYIGKRNDAPNIVLTGIKTLEYRGYDSWGIGAIAEGKTNEIFVHKQIGKIGAATHIDMPASSLAFGHTRWATHGGVTKENAHPHCSCQKNVAVIHNGIIENYDALKAHLQKQHTFLSQTDSEVAAHMIEEKLDTSPFVEAVRETFRSFVGSNALVAIDTHERMIVAMKTGSPLVVGFGDHEQMIASDAAGLLPHTKTVYFLEDGDMAVLTDDTIKIFDVESGKEKHITPTILTWDTAMADKGTYQTFMEKEIHEQETILEHTAKRTDIARFATDIKGAKGAYLIGCGTAYYACLAGTYLFSEIAKRHINSCVASEFTYQEDFLRDSSLVIALSQSGETMDLLDAVKRARQHTSKVGALVNVEGSTLWRIADTKLPVSAGPEIGVASTKDMTTKLALLLMTAYEIAGKSEEGKTVMQSVLRSVHSLFEEKTQQTIGDIAETIKTATDLFVVGRGTSYPAALETALKIKEISYIHAEGFAAGELKHGAIALIEQHTPCIVFAPHDETYGANLAAAMEMKARGGYIIGVSDKNHEVFDAYIPVPNADTGTIIPNIIVGQLLAYDVTIAKGLDPDKPRNLAKSVTVK